MAHPMDVCRCGDYRRQHKDGIGACEFNGRGPDACHGNEDCMRFDLWEKFEDIRIPTTGTAAVEKVSAAKSPRAEK